MNQHGLRVHTVHQYHLKSQRLSRLISSDLQHRVTDLLWNHQQHRRAIKDLRIVHFHWRCKKTLLLSLSQSHQKILMILEIHHGSGSFVIDSLWGRMRLCWELILEQWPHLYKHSDDMYLCCKSSTAAYDFTSIRLFPFLKHSSPLDICVI